MSTEVMKGFDYDASVCGQRFDMANASQLKALAKSHIPEINDSSCSIAIQIVADETEQGHGDLVIELQNLAT
jgi:hypothetical protein